MYESKTESDDQSAVHAALWRYRTRVSLEHLLHSIKSKDHKILSNFLHQVQFIFYPCMYVEMH